MRVAMDVGISIEILIILLNVGGSA